MKTGLLIGLGAAILAAPTASASTADVLTPPPGLAQAASTNAAAAQGNLGKAFASNASRRQGQTATPHGQAKKSGDVVPVFTLSPEFVQTGSGPVGTFAYAASAYMIDGHAATVDAVRQGDAWVTANIATGHDELTHAKTAQGAPLLYEPQVHAWYAVKGGSLEALNVSATKAIGGSSISLQRYAEQVHAKYAALLPGSSYDAQGMAGGFKDAPATTAAPAGDHTARDGSLAAAAGVVLIGTGTAVRRRRRS